MRRISSSEELRAAGAARQLGKFPNLNRSYTCMKLHALFWSHPNSVLVKNAQRSKTVKVPSKGYANGSSGSSIYSTRVP